MLSILIPDGIRLALFHSDWNKDNFERGSDYEKVNSDINFSLNRLSFDQILSLCFQKTNIGIYICCLFIFQIQRCDESRVVHKATCLETI
jgi:hypothetical protein